MLSLAGGAVAVAGCSGDSEGQSGDGGNGNGGDTGADGGGNTGGGGTVGDVQDSDADVPLVTPDATYDSPVPDPVGIGGKWVSGEDKKLVVLGGPEARTVVVTDGISETVETEYEVTLDEEYDPTGISFGKQAYLADNVGPKCRTLLEEDAFDIGYSIPGTGTKGIGANAGGNPMIIIEKGGSDVIIEVQNRTGTAR